MAHEVYPQRTVSAARVGEAAVCGVRLHDVSQRVLPEGSVPAVDALRRRAGGGRRGAPRGAAEVAGAPRTGWRHLAVRLRLDAAAPAALQALPLPLQARRTLVHNRQVQLQVQALSGERPARQVRPPHHRAAAGAGEADGGLRHRVGLDHRRRAAHPQGLLADRRRAGGSPTAIW